MCYNIVKDKGSGKPKIAERKIDYENVGKLKTV